MATWLWHDLILLAVIAGPMVYVVFFWQPCICKYLRSGEHCPRHGEYIQMCTREPGHDGPCNGWPCEWAIKEYGL